MRPFGSPKTLERRRRRAVALLESGWTVAAAAAKVGADPASVYRWRARYAREGEEGLAPLPVPGRPRKLRDADWGRLCEILLGGARAYGYANELWTLKRIARVIRREFGVRYHPSHVWKVLRRAKWSCQVPEGRALQRDERAIEHWKRHRWPQIKKSPPTGRLPLLCR